MASSPSHSGRIAAVRPPLDPDVQQAIDKIMRGNPPLTLFTTLARDRRLFFRYFGGGLLDRGHLTLRQREIVIDRTTALCRAEYEWGVHVTRFAEAAQLSDEQIASLTHGGPRDACWGDEERALIELCDQLHRTAHIDDELWGRLSGRLADEAILELLLLVGFYHSTAFVVNGLELPAEPGMARFDQYAGAPASGVQ
jgi:alkylhydroperoxidase family enzyme